jgi:hypothetical protein
VRFNAATIAAVLIALSPSPAYSKQHLDFVEPAGKP